MTYASGNYYEGEWNLDAKVIFFNILYNFCCEMNLN